MDKKELIDLLNKLTSKKEREFLVSSLVSKAEEGHNKYIDSELRVLAGVLSKMLSNGKTIIKQSEFKDVFSKVASEDGIARKYFEHELGKKEEAPQRKLAGEEVSVPVDIYSTGNKEVSTKLSSLWDEKNGKVKSALQEEINPELSKKAEALAHLEILKSSGLNPTSVKTVYCGKDYIVCNASFLTPKGTTNIAVPITVYEKKPCTPDKFASKNGFVELTGENIQEYVHKNAGVSFNPDVKEIVGTLYANPGADAYELQILSYKNKKSFAQDINEVYKIGTVIQNSDDAKVFGSHLNSIAGGAEFIYGQENINNGRDFILSKVAKFGVNAQVKIVEADEENITYGVSLNTKNGKIGFEVHASFDNGRINPDIISINDKVYDFSDAGIKSLISSGSSNDKVAAVVSPLYEMSDAKLFDIIVAAADQGNTAVAEEALYIVAQKGNDALYNKAFAEFHRCLMPKQKTAKKACGCSFIIKSANHIEPVCGHLNMPLDKIYQDEFGQCQPKYRQKIENNTDETVLFNTYKIFGF